MKVSKIAGIIAKARHYLELKNLTGQAHNQTKIYLYSTKENSKTHDFFEFSRNFSAFDKVIKNNEYI